MRIGDVDELARQYGLPPAEHDRLLALAIKGRVRGDSHPFRGTRATRRGGAGCASLALDYADLAFTG